MVSKLWSKHEKLMDGKTDVRTDGLKVRHNTTHLQRASKKSRSDTGDRWSAVCSQGLNMPPFSKRNFFEIMQNSQSWQLTPGIFMPKWLKYIQIFRKRLHSQNNWIKPCLIFGIVLKGKRSCLKMNEIQ